MHFTFARSVTTARACAAARLPAVQIQRAVNPASSLQDNILYVILLFIVNFDYDINPMFKKIQCCTIIQVTLHTKILKGKEYLYFQAGRSTIYLGPKDEPDKSKADNVVRALDYTRERMDHYSESFDELLPLLPPKQRDQYMAKEASRLGVKIRKYGKRPYAKSQGQSRAQRAES